MNIFQVKNQSGEWIYAKPIPGTFVCNIGDMLKVFFFLRLHLHCHLFIVIKLVTLITCHIWVRFGQMEYINQHFIELLTIPLVTVYLLPFSMRYITCLIP